MSKYPVEDIDNDLEKMFEGSYLPVLIKRELKTYILKHRIDELEPTSVYINRHGAKYVVRMDSNGGEISQNERLAQLNSVINEINREKL